VCNDKNQCIVIGAHSFRSLGTQTFMEANHFRDVFAALGLMLELMLAFSVCGVGPDGFKKFQFKCNYWMQFIRSVDDELELTIILMRFHILVWSGLDTVWMSKAFG
jgi:hypothetical protein